MEFDNSLQIEVNGPQEDADFIWSKIREFNKCTGPMLEYPPYEPYDIIVKDRAKQIVAGIVTRIYLKAMFVEVFWIDEKYRRQGMGKKLLSEVEDHARKAGCTFIHLDTFSFQAIDFYRKCGYTVFAVLDDYPGDIQRYFLKKYL